MAEISIPSWEDAEWIDCSSCGGSGVHEDECECQRFEDTCCLEPEPMRCSDCGGAGGWKRKEASNGTP